ncbi:MAG: nucleoside-diphosphate sugar epimerase/dehydratase [Bacteroidales bacterium]
MNLFSTRRSIVKLARLKYVNRWIIFAFDNCSSVLATVLSYLFIFFIISVDIEKKTFIFLAGYSLLASMFSFLLFRTYKGIIRHSTMQEAWRIGASSLLKVLLIFFFCGFVTPLMSLERLGAGVILDFLASSFVLLGTRIILINAYYYTLQSIQIRQKKCLVIGTASGNINLSTIINKDIRSPYQIVGFVNFKKGNTNKRYNIGGLPVYPIAQISVFARLVVDENIECVFFTKQNDLRQYDDLVNFCVEDGLKLYVLPSVEEVNPSEMKFNQIKEIQIEDLLGRDEIQIDHKEISENFAGKVILITGAAGSIGSELCRQLATFPIKQLILLDSAETGIHNIRLELEENFPQLRFTPVVGDIRSISRVHYVFEKFKPQIIFHAAAYQHVPLMEANPCEAVQVNAYGTYNLANYAIKYGVKRFVMISTDKAVNPTNIMGASKRLAEIYVQSLSTALVNGSKEGKTQFITTRFGNVLGSNGSVIPRFREQLKMGGPITVTHPEITRYFMTIREACRLVMQASYLGKTSEILVFDMGKSVRIVDLARRMIKLAGLREGIDIEIKFTGLRPGEKLYEELLSNKENTKATTHEKIRIAAVREYKFEEIETQFQNLIELSRTVQIASTVKLMKKMIPEFQSKNSEFEQFDFVEKE